MTEEKKKTTAVTKADKKNKTPREVKPLGSLADAFRHAKGFGKFRAELERKEGTRRYRRDSSRRTQDTVRRSDG